MSGCNNCSGNCHSCSGCSAITLNEGELHILQLLGQIPFLPVVRNANDTTPIYLGNDYPPEEYGLILQCLEKKQLINIDFYTPLKGYDDEAYHKYPIRGSFALTARGQQVLEHLDILGIE